MSSSLKELIHFIEKSPTAFHAVDNVKTILEDNGYCKCREGRLNEKESLSGFKGGYFIRNDSSLIAFCLPKKEAKGFRIMASHADSPCFKIKTKPEIQVEDVYVKLNVEKYGGMILSSWLDRPLGIAGRVIVKEKEKYISRLVNLKQCAVIPNVAIHFNREINKGFEYNPQTDLLPLFSGSKNKKLYSVLAKETGIPENEILGDDLYLYADQAPVTAGSDNEFILSPRLDDLECAYSTLKGFLKGNPKEFISVYCLFNNEEVGSCTGQGADSDFCQRILKEIWSFSKCSKNFECALTDSFLLSADNAHALHPNHPEKSDITNKPYLNGGIVLKFNGNAHYTTDAYSQAFVTDICRQNNIPLQTFANRSDIQGGSTLGNIMMSHVSLPSTDIGLPQLAMHSAVETAGVKDIQNMIKLSEIFYTN